MFGRALFNLEVRISKSIHNNDLCDTALQVANVLFENPSYVTVKGYLINIKEPVEGIESRTAELTVDGPSNISGLFDLNRFFGITEDVFGNKGYTKGSVHLHARPLGGIMTFTADVDNICLRCEEIYERTLSNDEYIKKKLADWGVKKPVDYSKQDRRKKFVNKRIPAQHYSIREELNKEFPSWRWE